MSDKTFITKVACSTRLSENNIKQRKSKYEKVISHPRYIINNTVNCKLCP